MSRIITPVSPDSPTVDLEAVRSVHLLAIAGTGMGSFARLLQQAGYSVRGSDQEVWPPMSDLLREAGIEWREGFSAENLHPKPDLVVVGNVIRRQNPEAAGVREIGLPHLSFPEALGALFLEDRHSVVVAGTHGKTTTTALVSWILYDAGLDPSFLVGGVASNLGASARLGSGEHFVIEGDEYDTAYFDKRPKLLHYRPRTAVLTSVEFDHADIFRDTEHYESAFTAFLRLLPSDGFLAVCAGDRRAVELAKVHAGCAIETYSWRADIGADWAAEGLVQGPLGAEFVLRRRGVRLGEVRLPMSGRHNVENALAAAAVCRRLGLSIPQIARGLSSFEGVARRQQVVGEASGVTIIDDFAHHPTAVSETVHAVRGRYTGRRLWAVFEPRSNTARRSIHQERYATAFDEADRAVISAAAPHVDVLAAAESLDIDRLAREIAARGTAAMRLPGPDAIFEQLTSALEEGDVVLLMSNGSFGNLPRRLLEALEAR